MATNKQIILAGIACDNCREEMLEVSSPEQAIAVAEMDSAHIFCCWLCVLKYMIKERKLNVATLLIDTERGKEGGTEWTSKSLN